MVEKGFKCAAWTATDTSPPRRCWWIDTDSGLEPHIWNRHRCKSLVDDRVDLRDRGGRGVSREKNAFVLHLLIYSRSALLTFAIGEKFGRRRTISFGAIWMIVGAVLQAAAINPPMIIAARVISGIGYVHLRYSSC